MPRHHERRHLPYGPGKMYALVADVARYPEFLPWVIAIRVRRDDPAELLADMIVGFKGLRERFTSRVRKQPVQALHVEYIEGPLKFLSNEWRFEPDGEGGCLVDFTVDFAFRNRLFETLAGQFFDTALRKMIGAFEARAHALYGEGSPASAPSVRGGSSSSSAQITA